MINTANRTLEPDSWEPDSESPVLWSPARRARPDADLGQWVVQFHVAGQCYSLPREVVDEILHMAELSTPPGAPRLLAGFLNLEGTAIPVIRLAELFGIDQREPEMYTPLIVLREGGGRIALWVDRVSRVVSIRAGEVLPVPDQHSFNNCAQGLLKAGDELSLLLDPGRLLMEQQRARLKELRAGEQKRLRELEESKA